MSRFSLGTLALVLVLAARVSSQTPSAECPTSECAQGPTRSTSSSALAQLWQDAAAAHQTKLQFVDAFQRFVRAQAGTFGDEGAALGDAVAAMRASLSRWDQAIAQMQKRATRVPEAEAHVALATVWLDRQKLDTALQELTAADRIANDRRDVDILRSLAFVALNRPEEAARALRRAAAIDSGNPTIHYTLAQVQTQLRRSDDAAEAWRTLERSLQRPPAAGRDAEGRLAPFDRVDLLRQVAGIAPVFPQSRYAAAIDALRAGDYERAVVTLGSAIGGDPMTAGAAEARRIVVDAAASLRSGGLEAARESLLRATDAFPRESEIHRLLGLVYWIDEQQGKSIEQLRAAIALAPDDERARMTLVDVLVSERRYSEAERELNQGPPSGQSRYRLSLVCQRQSMLPQAVKALVDSERFGPLIGRDFFYQSWGSLLVNQADFDGAVSAYARRIAVNPNSAEAHRQLGEIYILQGRHDEALGELLLAAWLDPKDARAHAGVGQVYARLLKYPDAIESLRRAVTIDPTLREARYTLGTVLMRVGKSDQAKTELDRFRQQQAEVEASGQREFEIDALRRQASTQLRDGDVAGAIAGLERVAMMDPKSGRSHRELGAALLRARRPEEAIDQLQQGQQIEETLEGFAQLSEAYQVAGKREESERARAAYAQAAQRAKLARIVELGR